MSKNKNEMLPKYDFSKGVKGKFFIPTSEIKLPYYLDSKTEEELKVQAERFGKSSYEFLQILVEKELEALKSLA